MTQQDKDLLLRDLCARLPYGVICTSKRFDKSILVGMDDDGATFSHVDCLGQTVYELLDIIEFDVKPYLRPMSNMTEEEHQVCNEFKHDIMTQGYGAIELYVTRYTNWLDKKHFDWRRTGNNKTLIEVGLALEAPEGMYKQQ